MKPEAVKRALNDPIQAITDYKWLYSVRPGKDNTQNTKFPFITNLNAEQYPLPEIKRLYAMRWGIETSFRDLKHTH